MPRLDELIERRWQLGIDGLRSMLAPELDEVLVEGRPCLAADVMRLTVGRANDDVAVGPDQRRGSALKVCRGRLLAVPVRNRAHARDRTATDHIHAVAGRPNHRVGRTYRVPHRRARPLQRLHFSRVVLQAPEFAYRGDGLLRKTTPDRLERLGIHPGRLGRIDAERIEFVRGRAAADSELETATA